MRRSRRWRHHQAHRVERRLRQGPGRPAARPGGRSRHARGRLRVGFTGTYYSTPDFTGDPLAVRNDPTSTSAPASSASTRCRSCTRSPCAGKARSTSPRPARTASAWTSPASGGSSSTAQKLIDVNANERSVLGEGTIELTAGQPAHIVIENVPFYLDLRLASKFTSRTSGSARRPQRRRPDRPGRPDGQGRRRRRRVRQRLHDRKQRPHVTARCRASRTS